MELLNNKHSYTHGTAYRAAKIFYLLFWLLKPFYLIESGSLQIGDICLGIAFLIVLFSDKMYFHVDKKDVPLFFFVMAVAPEKAQIFLISPLKAVMVPPVISIK